MEIKEEILKLRKLYGVTRKELADRCGISEGQLGLIELGKSEPKFSTVEKIIDALGCKIVIANKQNVLEVVGTIAAYIEKYAGDSFGQLTLNKMLGQGGSPRQTAEDFAKYLPEGSEASRYYQENRIFLPHHLTPVQYGEAVLWYNKQRKMLE